MSHIDWWDERAERISVTVCEDPKAFRVTYRGEGDKRFRVNLVQKPNPVGFRAKMPGDKRPTLRV